MDPRTSRSRRQFFSTFAAGATAGLPVALPGLALAAAPPARAKGAPPEGGGIFDVARFGAVGDGRTLATQGIQRAIDACAHAGGGLVLVPPGRFLTGALTLRSNIHFFLSAGATLLASERPEDYPPVMGRWEGIERKTHASLLGGVDLENVAITGQGVIEGQGLRWWEAHERTREIRIKMGLLREAENPPEAPLKWPRPRVIDLMRCQGVVVSGLLMRDGPSWHVHLVYCQDVIVEGVTIVALEARNCDGIVVDSSKQVRIANCSLSTGSDSISLKSGYNEDGRRVGLPCEDVVINNCNMTMSSGAGLSLGSETAGGIRNVAISNCVIANCRAGIHIKSPRGRGGVVERVRASNIVMDTLAHAGVIVSNFFDSVRLFYYQGPKPSHPTPETDPTITLPIGEGTPTFRDFEFTGLSVGEVGELAIIEGLPERFIQGVRLHGVTAVRAKAGVSCTRASEVSISDVTISPSEGAAVAARDVQRLEVHRLKCSRPSGKAPLVQLENVAGAFVHGCDVAPTATRFVELKGDRNRGVTLAANNAPSPGQDPQGRDHAQALSGGARR
jgi:polygalacturonase